MTPKCYSYIRFSSLDQLNGNSLNRQLKDSKDYAKKHGLTLDASLSMKDLGVSAFKGKHVSKGALGKFLDLVNEGKVPKGSILLVESLDRLSRQQMTDAVGQFISIVNQDIKIVTLTDGMEYSKENVNTNIGKFMMSIMSMGRAHEESFMKSKRLSSAWKNKRQNLGIKKLTAKCPAWLKLDKDKQKFNIITGRDKIIKRIFRMYLSGKGARIICRTFNQEGIESWGRSNGWHESYIKKILKNRSVIGEFQPHKLIDGKRVKEGEPILNYFPRIIEDTAFYKVQAKLKSNTNFSGQTGKVSNLFGGLAKCSYCKSSMAFVAKGKPSKGGSYLVCDKARRGLGCRSHYIPYKEFENTILEHCAGLDINEILQDEDQRQSIVESLNGELISLKEQLDQIDSKIQNLTDAISETSDKRVRMKLDESINQQFNLQEDLKGKQRSVQEKMFEQQKEKEHMENAINDLTKLSKRLKVVDVRLRVRNKLRELILAIIIHPTGVGKDKSSRSYVSRSYVIWFSNRTARAIRIGTKGQLVSILTRRAKWKSGPRGFFLGDKAQSKL
ncbi:MAG: recombinase family protein [Deltaproteobacteria bacterium]|nr:recombinase family protein [Deltaproteobacteria bacterium]